MKTSCLALAACLFLAGAAQADRPSDKDMKQIGLAYHNYHDVARKGPSKPDDLAPYFNTKDEAKRLVAMIDSGDVQFVFNVKITEMVDGTSNTVLAFEKDIAKSGGLALYGDGSVKNLTAAEFKKAIVAKPKVK
jgi:hypothetical protein